MAASAIQQSLDHVVGEVDSVARLFEVMVAPTLDDFRRFTSPHVQRRAELWALEWVRRVSGEDRPAFEAAARGQGLAGFRTTELGPASSPVEAAIRDVYYPGLLL